MLPPSPGPKWVRWEWGQLIKYLRLTSIEVTQTHMGSKGDNPLPIQYCPILTYSLRPWRWRQHIPPKRWYTPTRLHGIRTQNNAWIRTAVKSWYLKSPKQTTCVAVKICKWVSGTDTNIDVTYSLGRTVSVSWEETNARNITFFSSVTPCSLAVNSVSQKNLRHVPWGQNGPTLPWSYMQQFPPNYIPDYTASHPRR
jgi:hypothetical protein